MALNDSFIKNSTKHSGKAAGDKHTDGGGMYLLVTAAHEAILLATTTTKPADRLAASNVLGELLNGGVVSNNTPTLAPLVIKGKGGKTGKIDFNPESKRFEIRLTGLDVGQMHLIEKAVKALLS